MSVITNKSGKKKPAKAVQIGNSIGVILPKETAKELKIQKGDLIHLHVDRKNKTITLSKGKKVDVAPEFIKLLDEITRAYYDDLKKLAE